MIELGAVVALVGFAVLCLVWYLAEGLWMPTQCAWCGHYRMTRTVLIQGKPHRLCAECARKLKRVDK